MNLDIFVDALHHFSCGMLCFNNSKECYRCTKVHHLTADLIYEKIFLAKTMINDAHLL